MAEPKFLAPTLRESYNRRSRIWLRLILKRQAWTNVLDNISDILKISRSQVRSDMRSFITSDSGRGGVNFLIPLTGTVPVITFKNSYDRMISDLDFHTRAMADLMGAVGREAGGFITKAGKASPVMAGEIQGFGNMVTKVSKFVQAFGGNVMSPKVWKNGDVDDLRFGGRVGFENIFEWRYYRMLELVFQGILTPVHTLQINEVSQLLNNMEIMQGGTLDSLTLATLKPTNVEIDIDVIMGTAKEMTTDSPLILEEESIFPLLALDRVYLTAAEINHGTEDGKGFDVNGVSRIADYTLEFTIKEFTSVTDGMKRQWEALNFNDIKLIYTNETSLAGAITGFTGSIVDKANNAEYLLENIFLLGVVPGYLLSQVQGLHNFPSFVARRDLFTSPRLIIG
jgi:hypothetical protein